jgi:uncharacterized RDD family membrane protein YckC
MLIDHVIMTFVIMVFVAPGMMYDIMKTLGDPQTQPKLFLGNYYLNIFGFSLYFSKDIFLGRSPAKRILKLQVVDVKTNKPANPIRCLIRNITVILWPIEVIVALINNERRIGDFIAGTKLTTYDPVQHKDQPNWVWMVIALIAGMLIAYLSMFYPLELLTKGSGIMNEV